ncbi:interleukin-13 receptor subunit alpha-2 isoform X2 [Nelusetta ayraudi]
MASGSLLTLLLCTLQPRCDGLTVDPPENLRILDPGYLGLLQISWSPPTSPTDVTECQRSYQLEYFDTNSDSWSAVRTNKNTYSAQFDLMREVRVRVYTLLRGPCTNGTLVKSSNYTQLVQRPPSAGAVGTEPQNFVCVYYYKKYVECTWERSAKMSVSSQQRLWFWHRGLDIAAECPRYIVMSGGARRGCNFTKSSLPDFTDINLCVNGSSPEGPLRPKFFSLQIQNHVKPETSEALHLQVVSDVQLKLHWDVPASRVPAHCLEWEVEHSWEDDDGKVASTQTLTAETSVMVASGREGGCFSVRSRLHKYCAERSFWSEWSRASCHQEKTKVRSNPQRHLTVYVYVHAFAILLLLLLLLLLFVVAVGKMRSRQEKEPRSLLTVVKACRTHTQG